MNNKNVFDIDTGLKKMKDTDMILITSVIYVIITLLYELFYCNFEFFVGAIQNYNFSSYRIIVYIFIYFIFYKFKDKFIKDALNTLNSKVKCYFIYIIFYLTILLSISLICAANRNLSVNIIIAFISLLVFNLFALYISNSIIKNLILTSLLFGSIFSISVTFNNQLDEKRHFLSTYSVALGEFNLKYPKTDKIVADMPRMMNPDKFIRYFEQKPTGEIAGDFSNDKMEDTPNNYMTVSYLVSGIGIFISKILGRKYCRYIYNRKNF